MERLLQDLRFALRQIRRSPAFAFFIVATLAIGIGANTLVFTALDTILIRALPFPHGEQLVSISASYKGRGDDWSVSLPNALDWREMNHTFTDVAYYRNGTPSMTLTGSGVPERVAVGLISPNLFSVLGVSPALGRSFTAAEGEPNAASLVVLSDATWRRLYGADAGILGRTISLSGSPYTVIGVMPRAFAFPSPDQQMWVALRANNSTWNRGSGGLSVMARLRTGMTLAAAQKDMDGVAAVLAREYPDIIGENTSLGAMGAHLSSLRDSLIAGSQVTRMLYVLMAAVALVLLIACVNVANLLLARATVREREVAVRSAVGAARGRITRQLLTESLVLALVGGTIGVLLALWGTNTLPRLIAEGVSLPRRYPLDLRVLGFSVGITCLTGFVFGVGPAIKATSGGLSVLLGGRTGHGTRAKGRRRNLLVVAEVALAVVLLVSAGLVIRSLAQLVRTDPGFRTDRLLTMRVALDARYSSLDMITDFETRMLSALRAVPGVRAASLADFVPMSGTSNFNDLHVEGDALDKPINVGTVVTGTGYLDAMGIPLRGGRAFDEHDTRGGPGVAMVNEAFVAHHLQGQDAIGKRVLLTWENGKQPYWRTIIGVFGNVLHSGLDDEGPRDEIYLPASQLPFNLGTMAVVVRTQGDPAAVANAARQAIWSADPNLAVYAVKDMSELIGATTAMLIGRVLAGGLALFGFIALLLASLGLYGVISYSVAQRTYEIGVRSALGADTRKVLRMVMLQGLRLVGAGLVIGLLASFAATRLLKSLLHGVGAADPLSFAGMSLLLLAVAAIATAIPSRRAARIDPILALRAE